MKPVILSCEANNDLLVVLCQNRIPCVRFENADEAIACAPAGAGVMILADGYPAATTALAAPLLKAAAKKRLRLYVEYPSSLPSQRINQPRDILWERAVVASPVFGRSLRPGRILMIHGCRFVPIKVRRPRLVLARVAGFDTAVYGLPKKDVYPLLGELSPNLLVAASKFSQFVTGRYAPLDAWQAIWSWILRWLGTPCRNLQWIPAVHPAYRATESLPADVERQALRRCVDWFVNARLFIHPKWQKKVKATARFHDRTGPGPRLDWPSGNGSAGMLEGYSSRIDSTGHQLFHWHIRPDCIGEAAMAMACGGHILKRPALRRISCNLNDFIYFRSLACRGPRANPRHPAFGLVVWSLPPWAPYHYFGDDNARALLGTLASAALLGTDRWDKSLMRAFFANLRTSDRFGFRIACMSDEMLEKNGWRHYYDSIDPYYGPHYEAYLWACFLLAYRQTGFKPFLDRVKTALRMTIAAYPQHWRWTNGIQQERARILLPLAWLVRTEDTPEHRGWLKKMALEMLAHQDACGAIREELGPAGRGAAAPPASNERYGTAEATLIQQNGDPLADLLYTCNFAMIGLHEAAAATGEAFYRQAADRLTRFLCRIQARSESHPEFDGAWYRAFDYRRWEYWASNSDIGWGAWSIEAGWTQPWITAALALRQLNTSFWNLTERVRIGRHAEKLRRQMLPD
jgi:hypothetical protein